MIPALSREVGSRYLAREAAVKDAAEVVATSSITAALAFPVTQRGGRRGRGTSRGTGRSSHQPDSSARASVAPVALPPSNEAPHPLVVIPLAQASFNTDRPAAPKSSLGGETTCIVCFTHPTSQIAIPRGHQCVCDDCSLKMDECPHCCAAILTWFSVGNVRQVN